MKKLFLLLLFIPLVFACDYSTSRTEENSNTSVEESSTISVNQLGWLTGQREGLHDEGIL